MVFFFSVEQVATLPIWRQRAFVISGKQLPATRVSFSCNLLSGDNHLATRWASYVWTHGVPHTQETQIHISGIDGLVSRLDIIVSFHWVGTLAFHQESFPSWLLMKSFGKEVRFFHLSEVANWALFLLLWLVLRNENQRTVSLLLLLTLVWHLEPRAPPCYTVCKLKLTTSHPGGLSVNR